MLKISDAIQEIVDENPSFRFCLFHRLFNLTQFSKFILPLVEARVKKDVQSSAILMALSRLQKKIESTEFLEKDFRVENVTIHTNLMVVSYDKTPENHAAAAKFYTFLQKHSAYATLTEGVQELTLLFDSEFKDSLSKFLSSQPLEMVSSLSSLAVKFDGKYLDTPGFLYTVLQRLFFQGINVQEVASTFTEFIIYVEGKDATLAFDTLFNSFMARK